MKCSCTKIFRFCCAHQLTDTVTEKCKNLHGHSYKLEVTFRAGELNSQNMVMDFTTLKTIVQPIVDSFDHKCITEEITIKFAEDKVTTYKIGQPTAEAMGFVIWDAINKRVKKEYWAYFGTYNLRLHKIKLWEEIDSACIEIEED